MVQRKGRSKSAISSNHGGDRSEMQQLMETGKCPTLAVWFHGGKARVAHHNWSPRPQAGQPKLSCARRRRDLCTDGRCPGQELIRDLREEEKPRLAFDRVN